MLILYLVNPIDIKIFNSFLNLSQSKRGFFNFFQQTVTTILNLGR